uniref:Alpha/beta fold hydrolase n=1 Tax=Dictyoglomus thermophilum TaxID=14 RepID=A0A7C3RKG0_DICTH
MLLFLFFRIGTIILIANFFKRGTPKDDRVYSIIKNYPHLTYKSVQFKSNKSQILKGYIYWKKADKARKGIIVISHGFDQSHIDYINEINYFTNRGFYVMGFDNTGCGESEGESKIGIPQAVIDLDYALKFIEEKDDFKNTPILLFGVSWGGYAVCSLLSNPHRIAGVVSCAGFNSPHEMIKSFLIDSYGLGGRVISFYTNLFDRIRFGKLANITAIDGIKKSTIPILIMHSKDDDTVKLKVSIYEACKILNKPNVTLKIYDNKGHIVYLSDNAIRYYKQKNKEFEELARKYGGYKKIPKDVLDKFKKSIDRKLLNEIDQDIMDYIVKFFDKAIELAKAI